VSLAKGRNAWKRATIDALCGTVGGGTPPKRIAAFYSGDIPWLTVKDLKGFEYEVSDSIEHISREAIANSSANLIEANCVIVATRVGLGKLAVNSVPVAINQDLRALRPRSQVIPEFLLFAILNSLQGILKFRQGTTVKGIRKNDLLAAEIPLAPLLVQERIVEILQKANGIWRKRVEFRRLADQILLAAFNDLFGDLVAAKSSFTAVRLGELADVKGGVAKGRRLRGRETVTAPYLSVANVQDGFLDLTEVKTIAVPPADLERFHLLDGDILMTEGGDPDKLGRGCIWRGQIAGCIHQNHVFRVRTDRTRLLPEFLAALLRTARAKDYFRQAAKRSSNLASISSTQVKNFAFPLPPMEMQRKFLLRVEQWDRAVSQSTEAIYLAARTVDALRSLAFSGKLTAEWEATHEEWIAERQAFSERLPRLAILAVLLAWREHTGGDSAMPVAVVVRYLFLAQVEGELRHRLYSFLPGEDGPFSSGIIDDLRVLEADGLLTVHGDLLARTAQIGLVDSRRAYALLEEETRGDDSRIDAMETADADSAADFVSARLLGRRAELITTLRGDMVSVIVAHNEQSDAQLAATVDATYRLFTKKGGRRPRERPRPKHVGDSRARRSR
jgi:type I restriction enzyme S subunit